MALEQEVELSRLDLDPGTIDLVLDATRKPEPAVLIQEPAITGVEPIVAQHSGSEVGAVEIARHHCRRAHQDLALARRLYRSVLAHERNCRAPGVFQQAFSDLAVPP